MEPTACSASDLPLLIRALHKVLARAGHPPLYLAGGAVRGWWLAVVGRSPAAEEYNGREEMLAEQRDLDFTLPRRAVAFARELASELGGTMVLLDAEHDVARVVWRGRELDFAGFREQARSIEDDLARRDFTVNALAWWLNPPGRPLALPEYLAENLAKNLPGPSPASLLETVAESGRLLDPCNGLADLQAGLIRVTHAGAFQADPLRLLRAYRFQATLGFAVEAATNALLVRDLPAIDRVAAERVRAELEAILAAPAGAAALKAMAASGLLYRVLPELAAGVGLEQPDSHHLDVAAHCIETLAQLNPVLAAPARFFPASHHQLSSYLASNRPVREITLRWAALLHDLGKPATLGQHHRRPTFYNHDRVGAELCDRLARRLRFSRESRTLLQRLVGNHMWPFHLNNARRRTGITPRACLRLVRALGDDLSALFLLAMADSLAGRGAGKPPEMERELAALHAKVVQVARERLAPVLSQPPLLNGHDLQQALGLVPGPLFKELLADLEQARVEGLVDTREQALEWVRKKLTRRG